MSDKICILHEIKLNVYETKQKMILEAKSNYQDEYEWVEKLFVSIVNNCGIEIQSGKQVRTRISHFTESCRKAHML